LLVLWFEGERGEAIWRRCLLYVRTAVPIYASFILVDRLYQYCRFGSFLNTYVSLFASEQRQLRPWLPPSYPFETPFHVGFLGALLTPEKSIFLFDPLLVLTILLVGLLWKRLGPDMRAFIVSTFLLLWGYLAFYARYTVWSGDSAWGDRYVATAVELAAFVSVPLLLRHRADIGRFMWRAGAGLIAVSTAVQAASIAFWLPLELYQISTLSHPTFVVGLRFKNIVAFSLGKMDQWGLTNSAMTKDAWDYVHITTWNLLPFVLHRVGEAPGWVLGTVFAAWCGGLVLLGWVLWRLRKVLLSGGAGELRVSEQRDL